MSQDSAGSSVPGPVPIAMVSRCVRGGVVLPKYLELRRAHPAATALIASRVRRFIAPPRLEACCCRWSITKMVSAYATPLPAHKHEPEQAPALPENACR